MRVNRRQTPIQQRHDAFDGYGYDSASRFCQVEQLDAREEVFKQCKGERGPRDGEAEDRQEDPPAAYFEPVEILGLSLLMSMIVKSMNE